MSYMAKEPLLPSQAKEMADFAKATSCPVASGERLFTRQDFRPYFEMGAIDIAQPDVRFSEVLHIAEMTLILLQGFALRGNKRIATDRISC